jgi:isopenicillin-N N-acyltransferase-like protein
MKRPPLRILDLCGGPEQRGAAHGRTHATDIRAYLDERMQLVTSGLWSGGPMSAGAIIELAETMLPAHEAHNADLFAEMSAMAGSAGITPAEAIVVGGFTDFVDTVRAVVGGEHPASVIEDDCTAFIVPNDRAEGGMGLFAQTWDMHDTATDHVVLLRVAPTEGPSAIVFTTVGALGQIGMNELGVCVGINNLTATDGVAGVTWPQVVRAALLCETADEARDVILDADLAGGHNYSVFDAEGAGWNIEGMPSVRPVTKLGADALVHTNHTLSPETQAVQGQRTGVLQDSSIKRLKIAREFLDDDGLGVEDMMKLTRTPTVCQIAVEPYHIESSGGAVMRPSTRDFWAVWGLPSENDYERIEFL